VGLGNCEEYAMFIRSVTVLAAMLGAALLIAYLCDAHALTMQECSAKYKAAQSAGTLNGMKWNDFRKAECGPNASAAPTNLPAAGTAPAAAPPATTEVTRSPSGTGAPTEPVFPSAISPKYSSKSAGKARMLTCLDQYKANKANNGNGGLKWIEKGGGYYSECNKRLKG
jgi:hypothetical protein